MKKQNGFTLIEIAIVLLIVSIILGYTLAMAPRQQELKQFKQAKQEMTEINEAILSFAQVHGYLPCPALVASNGFECRNDDGTTGNCDNTPPENDKECDVWAGFVPAKTLGIVGDYNADGLLQDPWNQPYRYHVVDDDDDSDGDSDFVIEGEISDVGMKDLDPDLKVCTTATCASADEIVDNAVVVIVSTGKNRESTTDQNENTDSDTDYVFKPYDEDFDDLVRWISPNILYSKMIDADQLP